MLCNLEVLNFWFFYFYLFYLFLFKTFIFYQKKSSLFPISQRAVKMESDEIRGTIF